MELSIKQKECINTVSALYKTGQQIITIAGPAGSSKTSIIGYIIKNLGLQRNEVEYCAFTGKASLVLRNKGIPAQTIHHLIYNVLKNRAIKKEDKNIYRNLELLWRSALDVLNVYDVWKSGGLN